MYENMIICDLDDVLVDFINPAIALHEWTRKRLEANRNGRWDAAEIMELTHDQWWKPIRARGSIFWQQLPKLPWFDQLVLLLNKVSNNKWWVASAPCSDPTSYVGKVWWMDYHLPQHLSRTFINDHKSVLAKPGRYLIDDRPDNIEAFRSEGGTGILFPYAGNSLAQYADDPVPYLAKQLKQLGLLK